jgi:hypothetical protein
VAHLQEAPTRAEVSAETWLFDLFATGYDYLAPRYNPARHKTDESRFVNEPGLARGLVPTSIVTFLNEAIGADEDTFCRRLFIVLHDIDFFAIPANPYLHGPADRRSLTRVAMVRRYYHQNNRLNKNAPGHVVWKTNSASLACIRRIYTEGKGSQRPGRGSHLRREFIALCRAQSSVGTEISFRTLRAVNDPALGEDEEIRLQFVPLIERYEEAPFKVIQETADTAVVQLEGINKSGERRARSALKEADKKEAQIILFPELVVGPPVTNEIIRFMKEEARNIRMVLAGSFGYPSGKKDSPVFNLARVVGPGGNILLEQGKWHAYVMELYEKDNKDLAGFCPGKKLAEDLDVWPRFEIRDSAGARFCVLIREDFTQSGPFLTSLRIFKPISYSFQPSPDHLMTVILIGRPKGRVGSLRW